MSTPLLWEELFSLTASKQAAILANEDYRRAPDRASWLCVKCGNPSKRARTAVDRLCLVCLEPGREVPEPKRPVRRRRRAARRSRR